MEYQFEVQQKDSKTNVKVTVSILSIYMVCGPCLLGSIVEYGNNLDTANSSLIQETLQEIKDGKRQLMATEASMFITQQTFNTMMPPNMV